MSAKNFYFHAHPSPHRCFLTVLRAGVSGTAEAPEPTEGGSLKRQPLTTSHEPGLAAWPHRMLGLR